jgi:hypothetical protein
MSAERKPDLHLEIAHVLFIDVVGYSKLLADEQSETHFAQSTARNPRINWQRLRIS